MSKFTRFCQLPSDTQECPQLPSFRIFSCNSRWQSRWPAIKWPLQKWKCLFRYWPVYYHEQIKRRFAKHDTTLTKREAHGMWCSELIDSKKCAKQHWRLGPEMLYALKNFQWAQVHYKWSLLKVSLLKAFEFNNWTESGKFLQTQSFNMVNDLHVVTDDLLSACCWPSMPMDCQSCPWPTPMLRMEGKTRPPSLLGVWPTDPNSSPPLFPVDDVLWHLEFGHGLSTCSTGPYPDFAIHCVRGWEYALTYKAFLVLHVLWEEKEDRFVFWHILWVVYWLWWSLHK